MSKTNEVIISNQSITDRQKIKPYHFLSLILVFVFILSNIAGVKLIQVGDIEILAGIVFFPLAYIINDIITEVYGFAASRRAVWLAVILNLICALFLYFAVLMPDAPDVESNLYFNHIFILSAKIHIASVVSFVLGEYFNSAILAKTKIKFLGKFFAYRAILSTFIGSSIESFVFISIVFYGNVNNAVVLQAVMLIGIKIVYELIFMPITSFLVRYLKDFEQLDYYDVKTKFDLFSF